ncbi:MAG: epoxyqueuosine reductase QueH [Atopobiaceae bacterium]|nr:epoxyqueuosine reductase QueH [Atopobiaceae bacterium]MCH4214914.1 epoxyqueuosine reductase QueH [Atopobiaceae bacterium]MCH4229758.1 epoxyqueuosine reductase QueH [Atopobiaceae bacterium]MCH4276045.1 epoxyqueuosine reductase QueH [Atopobiaceae bacterium]MCI1226543.1 epoxyqueuosine reductase QueH [Atopobiaceae bacterium]
MPLMLHACCGPCSLEPVRLLREEGFEPTILWCNPNIQPAAEHDLRLVTLLAWAERAGVAVVEGACDREAWERVVAPHGMDRVSRCRACYALRLAETCSQAEARGFRYVSTTLAVSPYQLFDVCSEELEAIAHAHGLEPVVRDFRPQYPQATRESRELGMYRQNYCGCRFSAAEATIERQQRRDARRAEKAAARAGVTD